MNAPTLILKEIVRRAIDNGDISERELSNEDQITAAYDELIEDDLHYDHQEELRSGTCETDIEPQWDRHYETKSVAHRLPDGRWVGWTFWYGGGKHGEPDQVEWIDDAYFLEVKEEERTVKVRTWKVIEDED